MIVARVPRPVHAWRPLVVPVLSLLLWDVAVTVLYLSRDGHVRGLEIPLSLFGSAIALFIGFMVNAAYGRWWEGRILWGQIVNASRSLARQAMVLLDERVPDARRGLPVEIVRTQIAYVHLLRTALRRQELPDEALTYLEPATLADVRGRTNRPNAVLTALDATVSEAAGRGMVGPLGRLEIERTIVALTDAQGGLERIRNTPLPIQYRFLPRFFARVFCVILPFSVVDDLGWATPIGSGLVSLMFLLAVQIGDELAEPFADDIFDVPMTSLCRTVEIDLTEMIGIDSPRTVEPVDTVLW